MRPPQRHRKASSTVSIGVVVVVLLGGGMDGLRAQATAATAPTVALPSVDDKTGTNPLNLQTAVIVFNDFHSRPDRLFVNRSQYRYVTPLAGRRMSVRFDVPVIVSNVTGRTEAALGDLGTRWSWIPWFTRARGLLVGVDTTWNTSTNEALGYARATVIPFAQFVVRASRAAIVGMSYEQRLGVGGDTEGPDIAIGTLAVYLAWLRSTNWLVAEPQLIIDYEDNDTSGRLDVEWGRLLFGGVGTYIRPGVGMGSTRAKPFDWKLEIGFRVIP